MTERACGRCRFAVRYVPRGQVTGLLQCRRGPPAVIVVMHPGRNPGEVAQQIVSQAASVHDTYWCHEFVPLPEGESTSIESGNVPVAANVESA